MYLLSVYSLHVKQFFHEILCDNRRMAALIMESYSVIFSGSTVICLVRLSATGRQTRSAAISGAFLLSGTDGFDLLRKILQ
jgi:hypothetical protein